MNIRLIILIVVAAALAIAFAMRSAAPPGAQDDDMPIFLAGPEGNTPEQILAAQKMIGNDPLPGEEPEEEADFDLRVTVDTSGGKNRLRLYITEAHGYYVEFFNLSVWYQGGDVTGEDDSPLVISHKINNYLAANQTLSDCLDVVPSELSEIGDDIGTDADWAGEVVSYTRARAEDPATFPQLTEMPRCN